MSSKNVLINGNMDIWQRGETFNGDSGTPPNNDGDYVADRWILNSEVNDAVDVTKETNDVPVGSSSALKATVTTAGENNKFGFAQRIEGVNSAQLVGKTASLSFKAKTNRRGSGKLGVQSLKAVIYSWSGTKDVLTSPMINGTTNWRAVGELPNPEANYNHANNPSLNFAITTGWETYKVEGIELAGIDLKNLVVFIWANEESGLAGDYVMISQVQLEVGEAATDFVYRSIQEELALCQRYYEHSSDIGMIPGAQNDNTFYATGEYNSTTILAFSTSFKVYKRSTPLVTIYAYDGTSGQVSDFNAGGNFGATGCAPSKVGEAGYNGIIKTGGTNFVSGHKYWWRWKADAEI